MVRLESVLDSRKTVREDMPQAIEDSPANELDFKPMAEVMSFREIARHILDAGHGLTARVDALRAVVHVSSDERNGAAHHAAAHGEGKGIDDQPRILV